MEIKTIDDGRSHRRELWIDEETQVAHLYVIDYPMRIGAVHVRMAGIGDVYTESKHRRKGYMRILYEDTLTYMAEQGYDVSLLFGIENFYNKFGYASTLTRPHFKIKTRDAEAAGTYAPAHHHREMDAEQDIAQVLEMYNAHNAMRTGSIVRTPEEFTAFKKGTWYGVRAETQVWEDEAGHVIAYVVWDKDNKAVKVAELDAWEDRLYPALLAFLAEQAVAKRAEEITFYMPPDHSFAEYAQRYGIEWAISYPRYSDGMMRMMNQQPFFNKLLTEMERRLAASPMAGYSGSLSLRTDLGTTTLRFEQGKLSLDEEEEAEAGLELSQDRLMQLLMGYRSVRDVLNDPEVKEVGEAEPLANALFPKQHAYVWRADHF